MKIKFFKLAKRISINSDHPAHKIGAVLVNKNKVINIGFNQMKTSPHSTHAYKYIHAEFNVLKNLKLKDTTNCNLYVFREMKNNNIANAKPCESCFKIIKDKKIKNIFYTDYDGYKIIKL